MLVIPSRCSFHRCASSLASGVTAAPCRKTIFSGIQPTGVPHLGNYLGALQRWVRLQDETDKNTNLLFSVVDLHAITLPQDAGALKKSRRETFATLLAIGLDPNRCSIFFQSMVPHHSELMWILSCNASMGYLSRMTQWKSKLELDDNANPLDPSTKTKLKLGLFSYPVLQAADILVHRATHVPVGEDQSQHLEFAREIAQGFNHIHGSILVPPETLISDFPPLAAPAKRVMALDRPAQKMSKSHPNPKSRIQLTDTRDDITRKIRVALTDSIEGVSYDPMTRPGVSNLVDIVYHLDPTGAASPEELAKEFEGLSLKTFKGRVAEVVDGALAPIRERYGEILADGGKKVDQAAAQGAEKATQSADATMKLVREAIGL
ncbi:tryptophan-tRNA ligase [Myriangium duriaei CBS 260.36]|uniref:Tryptophan--tRNA ligase, mitochondrial n=1 Tax=Myriangium duriaei CBS 260.36 TaxID=1168546 RepID=A0A9P4J0N0_9PEZI|nr:tryptophan-tRNA ligase [Myriangium duriaei CBS 260.36]